MLLWDGMIVFNSLDSFGGGVGGVVVGMGG